MENAIAFTCRSILAASVGEIGGSDPAFVNISGNNFFRMRVLFDVPSSTDAGLMRNIAVTGNAAVTEDAAKESACECALRVLWESYGYCVLDYSLFRVWCCKERYCGLLEKLHQSKTIFESVSSESFEVFESFRPASTLLLHRLRDMRSAGVDSVTTQGAMSCVGFLQMMHVRAGIVRDQIMDELRSMKDHGDLNNLLEAAGFALPDNSKNMIGGLRMMLDRIAHQLGYEPPNPRIATRGVYYRWLLDFYVAGSGGEVDFRVAGTISSTAEAATETGLCKALLGLSVNRNVEIVDVNRDAYLFARERVAEVSSDIVALGKSGNSICSYFDSTRRGLTMMIDSYSSILRRHPSGEELVSKLENLLAAVDCCLNNITGPVRIINKNVAVALLNF